MLVCIETPDSILFLKPFLFEHVQNLLLIRYLIVAHNKTLIHTHRLIQLKPGVCTDILYFETFLWVCIQDFLKHFLSVSAHKAGNFEFSTQNFLIKLGCVRVFKGQEAANEGKHDDAAAPNIYISTEIFFASYHFRGGIARTATSCFKELSMAVSVAEAKVNYFNVFVMI
jgi:hypothetical protein